MSTKKINDDRIHILELRAKNVKCIKEVLLTEMGDLVEIRGDAGQGKTSILQSIEAAFNGIDPNMIRQGESVAEIELHMTDAVINRIRTKGGDESLMVKQNGKGIERAKEFLRTICGPSAFRPVEWVRMADGPSEGKTKRLREQRQQLLEALDMSMDEKDVLRAIQTELGEDYLDDLRHVDLSDVEFDQHPFIVCGMLMDACGDKRTQLNKDVKQAESYIQVAQKPKIKAPNADLETCLEREKSAVAAYHQARGALGNREKLIERAEKLKQKIQEEAEQLPSTEKVDKTYNHYKAQFDDLNKKIQDLKSALDAAEKEQMEVSGKIKQCRALQERIEDQEARIEDLEQLEAELSGDSDIDLSGLKEKMEQASEDRQARELQDQWDSAYEKFETAKILAERFQKLTEFFRDTMPKILLSNADLPVEGLGVEGDAVTVNGVAMHLLGTSEQIKVGVQVAAALNPRSGFVLVDGAESLGKKDRIALAEESERLGLQLIMTYVDPDAESAKGVTIMQEGAAKIA